MPLLDIGGTTVNFPYTPYECQLAYLEKVLQCLKTNSNGILESPTGTGKTLCLLCSTLAWLEDRKAQTELNRQANLASLVVDGGTLNKQQLDSLSRNLQQSTGVTWGGSDFVVPKIIYASRTHSQLSQAVQELKRTAYNNMKVSVIGSRDQLCIHEQVKKEKNNSNKIHMCRAKVAARTCHYYNRYEDIKRNSEIRNLMGDVVDIEDIVTYGEKQRVCPYYMTRELKNDADIIFMPYNYLLDPKMRMNQGIEIQGNVLIFDEAHNLERICEDSSSFELSPGDLATAIEELTKLGQKLMEMVRNEDHSIVEDTDSGAMPDPEFTVEDVLKLKSTLVDLEKHIDEVEVLNTEKGLTKPGIFIFELFNKVNIGFETKNYFIDLFEKMISFVSSDAASVTVLSKGSGLTKIVDVIKVIFSRDFNGGSMYAHQEALSRSYKVHIQPAPQNAQKKMDTWATSTKTTKTGKTLCYWCFSPGHRMLDLVSCGVKCIILTSGTLSPLKSFTAEMQIEFPVTLENPHVIERHQIFVGSMGKGPDNTVLNSNYETRFKESYQSSLGKAVVNFSRIVPKGLLIFFPSYPVMEKCIENWQSNGIYNSISQYKAIYVEPRGKGLLDDVMEDFYEKINNPALNGAIFAAVCRGKVSEGLDFSDDNGRAVIITGLPYPPRMDPKVNLKMQFLDEMRNKNTFKSLTGQEWYRQQASRAVNQAIGRVIRHRQDFGAILLCDTRFAAASAVSQLPLWVKPHVKNYDTFGKIIKDVIVFFKTTELKMPAVAPRPGKVRGPSTAPAASYFLPSISKVSATSSTKARNVADHVPSLKADEVSVERLRMQYDGGTTTMFSTGAQRGLLEALSSSKNDRYQDCSDEYSISKTADMKKMPGRKKIIVKKKDQSSEVLMSKQIENVTTVQKNLKTAEEYIQEIKKRLSKDQYKEFSEALISYKSSGDFGKFAALLVRLFTRREEDFSVLRQFYRFIRPKDKERFNELCKDLTGSNCGYKPEDGVSRKRVLTESENKGTSSDQKQPEKRLRGISDNVETKSYTESECRVNVVGSADNRTENLKNCEPDSKNSDQVQKTNVTVTENDGSSSEKQHENRYPLTRQKDETECICCKCKSAAKVPFQAKCGHVCCFKCWREVFDTDKLCPECKVRVKRRQMIQLLYS